MKILFAGFAMICKKSVEALGPSVFFVMPSVGFLITSMYWIEKAVQFDGVRNAVTGAVIYAVLVFSLTIGSNLGLSTSRITGTH